MPFIIILLFGFLSAIFALALELLLTGAPSFALAHLQTFSLSTALILFSIALLEEASKYIFLRQYARRFFSASRPILSQALLLGATFGLGFALPEIFLMEREFLAPPVMAFAGTSFLHVLTSIVFALSLFTSSLKRLSPLLLFLAATIFHMLYNTALFFI